jgi:hypothetical protein
MKALSLSALVLGLWLLMPTPAAAQRTNVGPGKCTDCHDHKDEKEWSERRDGDGRGRQHINALNQLSDPKSEGYAKAIGLADPYDVKGSCVKCHATTVRGSADFGVSCESCHGPGRDYVQPHQDKGSYEKALALGMKDVWKRPENWVKDCMTCHVLGDNARDIDLARAGHPTGSDFDPGSKFTPVAAHWTSKYTANQINAIGRPLRDQLLRRLALRTTDASPAPAAPGAPAPSAPVAPVTSSVSSAPSVSGAPGAPSTSSVPGAPIARRVPGTPNASSTPASASTPTAPVVASAPGARGSAPGAPRSRRIAPVTTPPQNAEAVAAAAPTAAPAPPSLPSTPAGIVASIQGRLVSLLDSLLGRGVTAPMPLTPPQQKTVYSGADADLLRLQEEVIALALEALGTAPAPRATPPKP